MTSPVRSWFGVVLLGMACSTLADITDAEECTETSCDEGFVCHQGRCISNEEAAPRAHLGFDIREQAASNIRFRVEVDGCDCTIEESFRELALRRSRVSQTFLLAVSTPLPAPDNVLSARFELTQASRYGQFPVPHVGSVDYPTLAEDGMTEVEQGALLLWPRYHPLDQDVPSDMVMWKVEPTGDLAHQYLSLIPPRVDEDSECDVDSDCCEPRGDCNPAPNFCNTEVNRCTAVGQPGWTFNTLYQPACSRTISGDVVPIELETFMVPDELPANVLDQVSVTMRYAHGVSEPFGLPILSEVPMSPCSDDSDCNTPLEFCELATNRCFVSLEGWPANRNSNAEPMGDFTTEVYTYCDPTTMHDLERRYEVTVDPSGALPTVNYLLDATFSPPDGESSATFLAGKFCVPDWGEGYPLEIEFVGDPQSLLAGDEDYTCCDVGCLPATADDVEDGGPSPDLSESCDGRTSAGSPPVVRVESHFVLEDLAGWIDAECGTPNPDQDGRLGSLARQASCTTSDAPCLVDDVALGTPEAPRVYEVRIESPVGSVVASGDFVIELSADPPSIQSLDLTGRTLVRGVVDLDASICAVEDCRAPEATILAERIRMPGEPETVPGPYFHSVSTFYDPNAKRDGAFILPLDPGGVYVVTALPPAGAVGGPSGFQVVDLREGARDQLEPLRLVLEEGVIVSLRLDQFDQRTVVIPLDRGSYLSDGHTVIHPGRVDTADPFIDLNRIGECWTLPEQGPLGCQIRRLIPESDLPRSQVGIARFTARRSDRAECTNECPRMDAAE